jgi:glutathione S-transferase
MLEMKLTALVTLAALIWTFILGGKAGAMRGKHGVQAPATTGHPEFEKAFRIQSNTNEQIILFLPLLWLSAAVVGDLWAALVGVVWIVGRVMYANAYQKDPATRGPGMIVTILSTGVLAVITLVGIIMSFL